MSLHINAKVGEIAPVVLMPGDPLRAKYIAEHMLTDPKLVSHTRNIFFYTGSFKDTIITVGASGMGCPSIGIYSYELYAEYDVECIIRIGTAGSYSEDIKVYDLINVDHACSESTYAKYAFNIDGNSISHQGKAFDIINKTALEMNTPLKKGNIHSSDIFYRSTPGIPAMAKENNCLAVEMEAFALFSNAQFLGKNAATILTISDVIPTGEKITADAREKSLVPMMHLALESSVHIHHSL
jgi:purine-nucleoside phosphorylase